MTIEQNAIKAIIIDEIFLISQTQINQEYSKKALDLIHEANSKNVLIFIYCHSEQNEVNMVERLKKDKILAVAACEETLNNRLLNNKLNLSDCYSIPQETSRVSKKNAKKVQRHLICSEVDFDHLLNQLQHPDFQNRSQDEQTKIYLLIDDPGSQEVDSLSASHDGILVEIKDTQEPSGSCSPGKWGLFGGGITCGNAVGLVTAGAIGYFCWRFVRGIFPEGAAAEIGIKLAFAVLLAGIGAGAGYGVSKTNCFTQPEPELERSYNSIV